MTPNRSLSPWKKYVTAALSLLFAADIALGVFIWQGGREGPETKRRQRDRLELQSKLLRADVERGEKIKASLPQVGKDCDGFFKEHFLPASAGYSAVVAELTEITRKAGLKTGGVPAERIERPWRH
jgi:hypothetical protein